MKGLLLKDILTLYKQTKIILLLMVVFAYQAHNAAGGQRQVKTAQPEAGIFLCQTV